MLLMAWTTQAFGRYRIPSTVYGIAIAGSGSLLLAGTDFISSYPDEHKEEHFEIKSIIHRGSGYYLFGIGFTLQILALFVGYTDLPTRFLSIETSNIAYATMVALSGIVFLKIQELVWMIVVSFFATTVLVGAALSAFTVSEAYGGPAALFVLVGVPSVGLGIYVLRIGYSIVRWAYTAMSEPFDFEDEN